MTLNSPEIWNLALPRANVSPRNNVIRVGMVETLRTRLRTFPEMSFEAESKRNNPSNERRNVIALESRELLGKQADTVELFLPEFLAVSRILPRPSLSLFIADVFFVFELITNGVYRCAISPCILCATILIKSVCHAEQNNDIRDSCGIEYILEIFFRDYVWYKRQKIIPSERK